MPAVLPNDWQQVMQEEMQQPYYQELMDRLAEEYRTHTVYPDRSHIFQALKWTPFEQVKAVILGQDPYHGAGQAHGLSFSVQPGVRKPPSLQNIFKELHNDLGCKIPNHGCLEHWAKQGVLLLNAVLTVREGKPNSHRKLGWENFTNRIIAALGQRERPTVFLLWGRHAQEKAALIQPDRHLLIESAHPSPLSAHNGFFGSRPFSQANEFLESTGQTGIDWQIPDLP
ncbi:uracil-DNA glycosylase [Cohnella pontilimi]|uniref:uracil-DNA glycosylase n=1 Tax=Cohnella pontilimi TaxID=2564100 RepID=UPI003CCC5F84